MRLLNKKVLILFSAVLLLGVAVFSAMSLLFADEENGVGDSVASVDVQAAPVVQGKSIIDYIIDNSHNTESTDQVYHVVEIYSSASNPSKLKDFVEGGGFEATVFNGNKSAAQPLDFNPGKIDYTGVSIKADDATIIAAINKADLIYLSEDPADEWTASNDITEDVKNALSKYASSDEKPLIIDSHNLNKQISSSTLSTFGDLADNYFEKDGGSYATNKWVSSLSAGQFMDPSDLTVFYRAVNGDSRKTTYWAKSTIVDPSDPAATPKVEYLGKVLTIQKGANDKALTDKFKLSFGDPYDFTNSTIELIGTNTFDATGTVLKLNDDSDPTKTHDVFSFGYAGRKSKPAGLLFETIDVSDASKIASLKSIDFNQYDFVIIEAGTKDVKIDTDPEVFNSFITAMKGYAHFLYSSDIVSGSGGSSNDKLMAKNVAYVYDKVATSQDMPRFEYILVCARKIMEVYAQATTGLQAKDIADIINSGSFRGIKRGFGDSSSVYTVLEVEPCYPIDEDLAKVLYNVREVNDPLQRNNLSFLAATDRSEAIQKQWSQGNNAGFYYLRTDAISSATTDELTYGDGIPVTDLLDPTITASLTDYVTAGNIRNVTDYYKWRVSKAKIAHATGRDYSQLQVVHMSSLEFASSRKTLLDHYDAIYFGGDYSAYKPESKWYAKDLGSKVYTMYAHNGDAFDYRNDFNDKAGDNTVGFFGGNDITASKLEELKKYAAKMPVIIDSQLSDAYVEAVNKKTNQSLIDPQSNMYKFLADIGEVTGDTYSSYTDNVLVNFDYQYTDKTLNEENKYGKTVASYATVFRGLDETDYLGRDVKPEDTKICEVQLNRVLNKYARPLIAVTEMPTVYSESDESTWIDPASIGSTGLQWKVDVTTTSSVGLYVDFDSNGRFTKDENVQTKSGTSVTLNWKPTQDFYGVVYWKVVAETGDGLSSSVTNVAKVKRTTQPKMYVNLLQIMPGRDKSTQQPAGEVNNNPRTLFLCTDCQFAGVSLNVQPYSPTGMFNNKFIGRVNTYSGAVPNITLNSTDAVEAAVESLDPTYEYKGNQFGSHTHDFGIVKYYDDLTIDGTTGWDDVTTNWFDIIRDDYDVDMTVMYTNEFESLIDDIKSKYAGKSAAEAQELIDGAGGYNELYNKYQNCYEAMQAVINGTYTTESGGNYTVDLAALESAYPGFSVLMQGAITAGGITTSLQDLLNSYAASSFKMDAECAGFRDSITSDKATNAQLRTIIDRMTDSKVARDRRKYYMLYSNYNAYNSFPADYNKYYCDWRDAKIFENAFYDLYQKYKRYASYDVDSKKINLKNVYSCMAIGAADYFYNDDITTEDANNAILDYIDQNGTVILFHDALNVKNTQTTVMTRKLSSAFGMNARHQKVSTDTVLIDKSVSLKIDGIKYNKAIDMNRNVQNRRVYLKQVASSLDTSDPSFPVGIKVGNATSSISGLTNSDKGYKITVKRTSNSVGIIKLRINAGHSGWEGPLMYEFSVPSTATKVTADMYCEWGNSQAVKKVENIEITGNNPNAHNITVELKLIPCDSAGNDISSSRQMHDGGNFDIRYAVNGTYKGLSNKGAAFTISSTETSGQSITEYSYEITDISKMTGSVTGNTSQEFIVTVLDASNSDAPVSSQEVEYTANGNTATITTDSSGTATFYRYNYKVSGYEAYQEEEVDPVTSSGGTTNDQTLTVIVKDVNDQFAKSRVVSADDGSNILTSLTDSNGSASFSYSNYIEAEAENPVIVSEDLAKYPKTTYFMSDLSGLSKKVSPRMLTYKGFHQFDDKGQIDANKYTHMYKYTSLHSKQIEPTVGGPLIGQESMQQNIWKGTPSMPTDKTQKNNEGIVTLYPFGIGNRMQISATAPGDYAIDIEDDDLIVYYSCIGGTEGTASSLFAADPMDGLNNYFIYQYGSVYYTGAGYSLITGYGRNNNDERKLYINIIVNSGRKSGRGPSLELYDLNTEDSTRATDLDALLTNKVVKPYNGGSECQYIVEIEDKTDFRGFDFLASIPSTTKFDNVRVWYDVNHTADITANGVGTFDVTGDDKLIYYSKTKVTTDTEGNVIEDKSCDGNLLKSIYSATENIQHRADGTTPMISLQDDCFDPQTGNQYAYIVVQVEDSSNPAERASATIRIQYKPALIDLN